MICGSTGSWAATVSSVTISRFISICRCWRDRWPHAVEYPGGCPSRR
jgi:hypothetical protein